MASRDQAAANAVRNGNDTLADLEAQKNKEEAGRLHAMPPRIVRQCPGLHLFTRCSTVWMNQDIVNSTRSSSLMADSATEGQLNYCGGKERNATE